MPDSHTHVSAHSHTFGTMSFDRYESCKFSSAARCELTCRSSRGGWGGDTKEACCYGQCRCCWGFTAKPEIISHETKDETSQQPEGPEEGHGFWFGIQNGGREIQGGGSEGPWANRHFTQTVRMHISPIPPPSLRPSPCFPQSPKI